MLGGSSAIHVSQLHSLVDYLLLGGRQRGFTPKASVSSSITHHRVILCLHLSSLTLVLASLFPYSCALLLLFVVHDYVLE